MDDPDVVMTLEMYRRWRGGSLRRLSQLRMLGAPRVIIRREQMILWAFRRWHHTSSIVAMVDLPGWTVNYTRFVRIHESESRA